MRNAPLFGLALIVLSACGPQGLDEGSSSSDADPPPRRLDRPDVPLPSVPARGHDPTIPLPPRLPADAGRIGTARPDATLDVAGAQDTADRDDRGRDPDIAEDASEADAGLGWLEPSHRRWRPEPVVTTDDGLVSGGRGNLGLSSDRLLWSGTNRDIRTQIHLTELDSGADHVLYTTGDGLAYFTGMMVAGQRFVSWAGNDGVQSTIFLYDLGADGEVDSGDELFPDNPFALVQPEGYWVVPFDWDFETFELAYVETERSSLEVRRYQVIDGFARLGLVQGVTLCTGCVEYYGGHHGGVAIDGGCLVFSDADRQVRRICRNNAFWGDGDDSDEVISNTEGACAAEFTKVTYSRELRGLDLGRSHGRSIAAWIATAFNQDPSVTEVCLWGEGGEPARRISQVAATRMRTLTIGGDRLFWIDPAPGAATADWFQVMFYPLGPDLFSGSPLEVPILPGRIGRLFTDAAGRVVVARQRDGPDFIELYDLRERPTITRGYDRVAPDVDGDRLVWIDYRDHRCGEVYLLDRSDGGEHRLTQTPCPEYGPWVAPMCPRVSGDFVVWTQAFNEWSTRLSCFGEVYGLELGSSPPYDGAEIVHISSELTGPDSSSRVQGTQVSEGRVVMSVSGSDGIPRIYVYEVGGDKPRLESPAVAGWGFQPDISGDRLAYVGGDLPYYLTSDIRTCRLGEGCSDPVALTTTDEGCSGFTWEGEFYCYPIQHYRPKIQGDVVVWLDNRESYVIGEGYPTESDFHLYAYDFSDPIPNGIQVSTTPWRTGSSYDLVKDLIRGTGSLMRGYWDVIEPSLGFDPTTGTRFVLITTLDSPWPDGVFGHHQREVLRVDLNGSHALEERLPWTDVVWQSPPAADAWGHIVWQERSDGTVFRIRSPGDD